jgi:hypothetical protein
MSMTFFGSQAVPTTMPAGRPGQEQTRLHYAFSLARYVEGRRRQLNLLIDRAAELTGIEFSEWCALESGWVPTDENTISAIAEVLEVNRTQIFVLAIVARANSRPA